MEVAHIVLMEWKALLLILHIDFATALNRAQSPHPVTSRGAFVEAWFDSCFSVPFALTSII